MSWKLQVCMQIRSPGASCGGYHGGILLEQLRSGVGVAGIDIVVESINCFVKCEQGPNVRLLPDGKFWHRADQETVDEIVRFLAETSCG